MTTFSKHGFNAAKYLAHRPIYNQTAYTHIVNEHKGGMETAVDIGCGPGTVTIELAKHFRQVIGIDPSNNMIQVAQQASKQHGLENVTFRQGYGEDLPLDDQSVDVLTVAQSLHWLDPQRFLSEVTRVLRQNGTLIAWGYMFGRVSLPSNNNNNNNNNNNGNYGNGNSSHHHCQDTSQQYDDILAELGDSAKGGALGPYWEKNRAIATAGFISWLPAFQTHFQHVQHWSYPMGLTPMSMEMKTPWMDDTDMSLGQLIQYVKTWSSYKNWLDQQQQQQQEKKGEDVVDAFFKDRFPLATMDSLVHVQWPHSVFILSNPRIPYSPCK